jgi:hypothetical protein
MKCSSREIFKFFYLAAMIIAGDFFSLNSFSAVVVPGGDWYDNNNKLVEAHDGGMIKKGSTYFLYGNDRTYYNSGSGQFNTHFPGHGPAVSSWQIQIPTPITHR